MLTSSLKLPPPSSSTVARTTLVLEAFDSRASRLSLDEVAQRSRLPRAAVHRILKKLVNLGWLDHNSRQGYRLGDRAVRSSVEDERRTRIRAVAAPWLYELHKLTGLVAHVAILEDGNSVYIDKIGGCVALTLPTCVGDRRPAFSTAAGKALLSSLSAETVDKLYKNGLHGCTSRTISELSILHGELARVRNGKGVAFESGESYDGIACVGCPVRGVEGDLVAVSLSGGEVDGRVNRSAAALLTTARKIERSIRATRWTAR